MILPYPYSLSYLILLTSLLYASFYSCTFIVLYSHPLIVLNMQLPLYYYYVYSRDPRYIKPVVTMMYSSV